MIELAIPIMPDVPRGDSIADRIKRWRLLNGVYQKDLANRLEVDEMTIVNWEKGRTKPKGVYAENIANTLGISI